MSNTWGIPELQHDKLATQIPACTFGGGVVTDPEHTLVIFRTASLSKARGCVVGFYVDDFRFEGLWRQPARSIDLFLRHGITAAIEPDYSLWTNDALAVQLFNVFRMRTLGRLWQDA